MERHRRAVLRFVAGVLAVPAIASFARAQSYPSRPVRIIVGFAPGGTTDIAARLIAQWLSERFGQPFVIENRPGASANLAAEAVARAAPDGHTLLAVTSTNMINVTLFDRLAFDLNRDFVMVAGLIRSPFVLEVNPALPARTVPELIAHTKANPSRIAMASFGTGTSSHVAGELLKMMTGVDLLHVPYRGSAPMITDLIGGQVQVAYDNLPASIEYIRGDKLRALAVTTAARSPALPEIPALADFVPGYEASAIVGIAAPRNTPPEIVERLNREINAGLADPKLKTRFTELSAATLPGTSGAFATLVGEEAEKWGKVIRTSNIKPE
jgi:tripartite-type tricarboxylate transporter receptor subunit TctC